MHLSKLFTSSSSSAARLRPALIAVVPVLNRQRQSYGMTAGVCQRSCHSGHCDFESNSAFVCERNVQQLQESVLNTTAFVLGLALSDIRGYKMEAVEACCPQMLINRMTTSPGLSECERRNPETHHNTPVEDESSFTSGTIPKTNTCAKRDRHCGESIRRAPPRYYAKE